jgi:E3 ubiquitin-protein ligase HUWE1
VNRRFRLLVTLETRVTLLSEVYATGGYTTGRTAFTILESLLGPQSPKIVPDLGALHRACTWEHIVFKAHLAHTGVEPHPLQAPTGAPDADIISADASPTVMAENVLATGALPIIRPPAPSVFDRSSAPKKNAQALRHVVTQMPAALSPLFQGTLLAIFRNTVSFDPLISAAVKLFTVPPRRNTDTAYKQLVADSAPVLAEVMLQHLSKTTDGPPQSSFSLVQTAHPIQRMS